MKDDYLDLDTEEWGRALLLFDSAIREVNTKLAILNNEFKLAHQSNPIEHITSRIKSVESIAKKMKRYGKPLTVENVKGDVSDVAGVRVICSFTSDVYRVVEAITNQNDIEVVRVKDYIKKPKETGYRSYHMIVEIPVFLSDHMEKIKVELQIRTIAMDFWASLEHKIKYQFGDGAPQDIKLELVECANIISFLDRKMLGLNDYVTSHLKEEHKLLTGEDMAK